MCVKCCYCDYLIMVKEPFYIIDKQICCSKCYHMKFKWENNFMNI